MRFGLGFGLGLGFGVGLGFGFGFGLDWIALALLQHAPAFVLFTDEMRAEVE